MELFLFILKTGVIYFGSIAIIVRILFAFKNSANSDYYWNYKRFRNKRFKEILNGND